jgi:hypothetical protein
MYTRKQFLLPALLLTAMGPPASALDICGCEGHPSLGDFHSVDEATYPPGTVRNGGTITIPLPDDGVLIFDSFTVDNRPDFPTNSATVGFGTNAANTGVTLLVSGDLTIASGDTLTVSGSNGGNGSNDFNGFGGVAGPGGFRGGDGAYQLVNFQSDGGAGLGPGGGDGATFDPPVEAQPGQFLGSPRLLPLIGGSGGGGGRSDSDGLGCSGGGGGGGGGAILAAVNGTATITGLLRADGGRGGSRRDASCSTSGDAAGGGAVRIIATSIAVSGQILAHGDPLFRVNDGVIRLEAFSFTVPLTNTDPIASLVPAPGPLADPLVSSVAITGVAGETVSLANNELIAELPQGNFGQIDVRVAAPGLVAVDFATSGVPVGDAVDVIVKPSPGGLPFVETATLAAADCDAGGNCSAQVQVDLAAGSYVIEAQTVFQAP